MVTKPSKKYMERLWVDTEKGSWALTFLCVVVRVGVLFKRCWSLHDVFLTMFLLEKFLFR